MAQASRIFWVNNLPAISALLKSCEKLRGKREISFGELVAGMVAHDLKDAPKEAVLRRKGSGFVRART
jgi:hypothetical protein